MHFYRLAAHGFWLDIDPVTGEVRSLPRKSLAATTFPTESSAQAALARAKQRVETQFASLFPPDKAPPMSVSTFCGFSAASKGPQPALTLAILAAQLADCSVETFDPPNPPGARIVLPSLYAIVSEKGCFAREENTGYMAFTERLDEASLFESAQEAKTYLETCEPRSEEAALAAHARILELRLSPGSSWDPATLAASDNEATALMRDPAGMSAPPATEAPQDPFFEL